MTTAVAWMAPVCALIGICMAAYLGSWVLKQDPGPDKMNSISIKIQQGAKAFLMSEYKLLVIFMVIVAIVMAVALSPITALAFVTGGKAHCMVTAQDHKRAFDGDRGPNTGGMGVYSPVPIVTADELAAMHEIMEQSAAATATDFANDYRGVLYGGFMLTPEGPKVLEFNARFGDPETQVVLPRLEADLVDIVLAVAEGRPDDIELRWSEQWAVCVVLASEGYPGAYEKGKVILGIEEAEELEGVTVFHAGTARNADGELVTAGGRVLNVVALGDSFDDAREKAYEACNLINFEGKQYRTDIGKKAAAGREAWN